MTTPNTEPAYDELADEFDELGWDVEKHGRMVNHQAVEPITIPWGDDNGLPDDSS